MSIKELLITQYSENRLHSHVFTKSKNAKYIAEVQSVEDRETVMNRSSMFPTFSLGINPNSIGVLMASVDKTRTRTDIGVKQLTKKTDKTK